VTIHLSPHPSNWCSSPPRRTMIVFGFTWFSLESRSLGCYASLLTVPSYVEDWRVQPALAVGVLGEWCS
jgi:hypothetical protein